MLDPEPLEARLELADDPLGREPVVGARVHRVVRLGREHRANAPAPHPGADHPLAAAAAVGVGGVEVVDPLLPRGVHQRERLVLAQPLTEQLGRRADAAEVAAAERDARDRELGAPQALGARSEAWRSSWTSLSAPRLEQTGGRLPRSRRHRLALAAALVTALVALTGYAAAKPTRSRPPGRRRRHGLATRAGGPTIQPGFLGLSLENTAIIPYAGTDPKRPDPVFLQLVRNLTPGSVTGAPDRRRQHRLGVVPGPRPDQAKRRAGHAHAALARA